jgi:hypothetical protein
VQQDLVGAYEMKINDKVESILKHDRASRNSDTRLLIVYLQKSGMELTDKQIEVFKNLPSMETITRVRRQLQEQGKYEADEAVNEMRYKKFQTTRENIKSESAEEALARIGYRIVED